MPINTKPFHVVIQQTRLATEKYYIQFFYETDLRYDRHVSDIPMIEIVNWIKENDKV